MSFSVVVVDPKRRGLNCFQALLVASLAVMCWSLPSPTQAQTLWTDGVGDWFTASNWSLGVPNPSSPTTFDARIENGGIAQIFAPGASARRITLGTFDETAGGILADAGSLNVTENLYLGESGGMGNMTIRNNADVSAGVTVLGVFSGSGLMTVSGDGSTLGGHTLILGELASGTMVVREGADVSGFHISLANTSSSAFGTMTVTGAGSTLGADDTLWIGRTGVGELRVAAGGAATAPTIDIGSNAFGSGLATITGAGSTLSSTNTLLVGNNGFGTMIISDGGRVNSIALGLGFASGGSGTVTVTGAGSRVVDTFNSISVGSAGSGALNIADGGAVTVNSGFGSVVVGATPTGFASTLRIGTGAAPGTLEAGSVSLFRASSLLELNHTGVIALGMPISGPGSVTQIANGTTTLTANNTFTGALNVHAGFLEISGGGQINNAAASNVATAVGQVASLSIKGAGSKWVNAGSTVIGATGTGSVSVEAGGELRSDSEILVNRFAAGNGALLVTGAGSKAMTVGELRIADEGVGLVAVQDGGAISSGFLELARQSTGNASAIVTGSGSLWTVGGVDVGRRGTGALRIENGGKVWILSNVGVVGDEPGAVGTIEIDGLGSTWESNSLIVGASGAGTATISGRGGIATGAATLGLIASGVGTVTVTGAGTAWTNTGNTIVGNFGRGTVLVQAGASVTSPNAAIGFQTGGSGSVTVDGAGSRWDVGPGNFIVGGKFSGFGGGNGTLNITNGGVVTVGVAPLGPSNGSALIGFQDDSVGTVNVSGAGSLWNPKYQVVLGDAGNGTMNITAGGRVETNGTVIGLLFGSTGALTVSGAGSMMLVAGNLDIGSQGTGALTIADSGTVNVGGTVPVRVGAQSNGGPSTLRIGAGGAPGVLEAGSVVLNLATAKLEFNHTGALAFTIPISGAGSVTKLGFGTTTLSADSSYTGGTTVVGGGLTVTNANGLGLGSGPAIVNPSPTSRLTYVGSASAGSIAITNRRGLNLVTLATTVFQDNATAAGANITNEASSAPHQIGGRLLFNGSARAGTAQISNAGATVGDGIIGSGFTEFRFISSAESTSIVNHGGTQPFAAGGVTHFFDSASAGASQITNQRALGPGGGVGVTNFLDTSFANSATIINEGGDANGGGGQLAFLENSTASLATITNQGSTTANTGGLTRFLHSADAFQATITMEPALSATGSGGKVMFEGASRAGGAILRANGGAGANFPGGAIQFIGSSTAGASTISVGAGAVNNALGASLTFQNSATAEMANVTLKAATAPGASGGSARFQDMASAGAASFTLEGAGVSNFQAAGRVVFTGNANAGTATFTVHASTAQGPQTSVFFEGSASAASATIINRGAVGAGFGGTALFDDDATAADSTITNEGGAVAGPESGRAIFEGQSSAGNADITSMGGLVPGASGGRTIFLTDATASTATLRALGGAGGGPGGSIRFHGNASGGEAAVITEGNGYLEISELATAGTTVGSIAGSGSFLLGAKTLTVGSNNTSTVVSGSISGAGGSLTKVGSGTLTLSFANSFTGALTVNQGSVLVTGSVAAPTTVNNGGALGGTGMIAAATINAGGTLSPGLSMGTLTTGSLTLAPSSISRFELSTPGVAGGGVNDLITVNGNLLFGGTLAITTLPGFAPGAYPLFTYTNTAVNQGLAFESSFLAAHPGSTITLDSVNKRVVANITAPPLLAADFDEDGDVDGADLTRWRNGFGAGATHMQGDANGDADVDGADFLTWQRQLGSGAPASPTGSAIPEPASAILCAICGLLLRRRRAS